MLYVLLLSVSSIIFITWPALFVYCQKWKSDSSAYTKSETAQLSQQLYCFTKPRHKDVNFKFCSDMKCVDLSVIDRRKAATAQIQGYVKIGDLVDLPSVEANILSFTTTMSDFDNNILRFSSVYQQTISYVMSFISTFCIEFESLLGDMNQFFDPLFSGARGHPYQGDPYDIDEQRQHLITRFQETKTRLLLGAIFLRNTLALLFQDTVSDLYNSPIKCQVKGANPLFRVFDETASVPNPGNVRVSTDSSTGSSIPAINRALLSLNLLNTHPSYTHVIPSLKILSDTQPEVTSTFSRQREDLYSIDDTLADFTDMMLSSKLDNLASKASKAIGLIAKLNDIVKAAIARTQDHESCR